MNASDAIKKIAELLSINTKPEKFMTTVLVDDVTEITNNKSDEEGFQVGDELFIKGETTLSPAPEGEHITREGVKLYVGTDSIIYKIEMIEEEEEGVVDEAEVEVEDETSTDMMSSAVLTDGTKVETDTPGDFVVGDKLFVITESGERVEAPEGEHTTESGIVLVVDGEGFITGVKYPDEAGEGSLEDMKRDMETMKEAMSQMLGLFNEMNKYQEELNSIKAEFNEFRKQPDRSPVVKHKSTPSVLDLKYELIKNSLRK